MQNMAQFGRNGDDQMAHVSQGELVVPPEVLNQRPQIARGIGEAFRDVGADPLRYVVGSKRNSINPITGEPEFFLDKIIPFLTKAAKNPIVQGAVGNLAVQAVRGKKPSLKDALIGGAVGGGFSAMTGGSTGIDALDVMLNSAKPTSKISAPLQAAGTINKLPKYKRAEGLLGIGELFNTNPEGKIGRILNTKAGEALALGLGSVLLDSIFSEDEDKNQDPYGIMERFNRGAGQGPVRFRRVIRKNKGGAAYYPYRSGGIMPNEGSGTKDDVPAMLTAGEFVMTRDAVKGAGDGNLNKGIQNMYEMMHSFEDMR